jgi:hypothetical protein
MEWLILLFAMNSPTLLYQLSIERKRIKDSGLTGYRYGSFVSTVLEKLKRVVS